MSTTTASAEIEVPREFRPAFVIASNFKIMDHCEALGKSLSLDHSDENRRADDIAIASLTALIEDRASLLRALDDDAPVAIETLRTYVDGAIEHLECLMHDAAAGADNASPAELVRLANDTRTLGDLSSWNAMNLRVAEAVPA